jgi:hypothetical protein
MSVFDRYKGHVLAADKSPAVVEGKWVHQKLVLLSFPDEHAFLFGPLYGIAVYFFMNRVVVQLSAATKYPFSLKMMLIGLVIHIFCVGTPIALAARRFLLRG